MKKFRVLLISAPFLMVFGTVSRGEENIRFASAVQLVVQEATPQLQARARRVVLDGFSNVFHNTPELRGQHFRVVTSGNEVALYFDSDRDLRQPFQEAVLSFVQGVVNQSVRGTGRMSFYRTAWEPEPQRYFHVSENPFTRQVSIRAKGVPLRAVLRELRSRFGGVSYLIPGQCGDQIVEGNFERDRKDISGAVEAIANSVGLQGDVRNGAYVFTGNCNSRPSGAFQESMYPFVTQAGFGGQPVQVVWPLSPLAVGTPMR